MRADGLPYIPPCPVCLTDTPRFLTIGLTHWAIRCRDKNCAFQLKCEGEDMLRGFWLRLQPVDADIARELLDACELRKLRATVKELPRYAPVHCGVCEEEEDGEYLFANHVFEALGDGEPVLEEDDPNDDRERGEHEPRILW